MTKKLKILAVIPARGGSQSIKKKNIKKLGRHPLLAYTVFQAKKSKLLTDVVVSSDDLQIINIAKKYGAQAPFVRPKNLATSKALAVPTIQHAVSFMENKSGQKYDYVLMLQPTCPFTLALDVDGAIKKLIKTKADSVISVVEVGPVHPWRMKKIVGDHLVDYSAEAIENMPRQNLPKIYIRSGDVYATKRDVLMKQNTFKGKDSRPFIIPLERAMNIDSISDFWLAEKMLENHQTIKKAFKGLL
ncbi:MAG: acylneuraminate cytidylyltransferase family protein [Candidatus Buchananbacteria bacterium]